MLAKDIIHDFDPRGFTLSIADDGGLSVTPASQLTNQDRTLLKAYKTELVWRLKHPDGDPEVIVTAESCAVCGAELLSDNGKRYRRVRCPAGCMSGWRPPSNQPHVDDSGDLIVSLNCEAKYRYWRGGQSVQATLKELNAPDEVLRRYRRDE